MKLKNKLIFILIVVFLLINLFSCVRVSADGVLVKDLVDYVQNNNVHVFQKANRLTTVISFIIAIIQVGCTGFVIIYLTVVGIRYMLIVTSHDGGNAEVRRGARTRLFNAIIRAALLFGAANLLKVAFEIFSP